MSAVVFAPQPGPQTKYLQSEADILIFGGSAGGGKTYALMLDTLQNLNDTGFEAVIFRRLAVHIDQPGGLWDESEKIFPLLGGHSREGQYRDWTMPDGLHLKFSHLQHEKNVLDWQGSQMAFIGFDELTHFTRRQFFYMLSRLRSGTGLPGRMRGTCNPDADSWVKEFIKWWLDPDTGFPIPERDGVLRWFIRQGDDLVWEDSLEIMVEKYGPEVGGNAKSVTFIRSQVYDNKILLERDPSYLANLNALDRVERGRLLEGNWNIRASAGNFFRRSDFKIVKAITGRVIKRVRYWDRAATKPNPSNTNPDWTRGVKMAETEEHQFYIEHCEGFREGPLENERRIKNIASTDPKTTTIGIEQDPGQAGKVEAEHYTRVLRGYDVRLFPVHKAKETRARPYAAQVEAGNVFLLEGPWNEAFILEHENFPPGTGEIVKSLDDESGGKDDQVDAASGAFNFLTGDNVGVFGEQSKENRKGTHAAGLKAEDQW